MNKSKDKTKNDLSFDPISSLPFASISNSLGNKNCNNHSIRSTCDVSSSPTTAIHSHSQEQEPLDL
ncbi:hypothetical protein PCANC_14304 [Puccinia coronata f. sp. avenae]|uniref:Uncharacterized protein n=1 Tax=Puccinia coronata f. sp. avenae TaxID=200324 RepID=A0A2N5VLF3_9BASI|nr:hypothetical protein PCANC_14304 [Puccinia coronata f. sp. avenae]